MIGRIKSSVLLGVLSCVYGTIGSSSSLDNIAKPNETDTKPTQNPTPSPTTSPDIVSPPPVNTTESNEGFMELGVRAVANMENAFHITDYGFKAQCVDDQGVVSQAKMDIYAVINGEKSSDNDNTGYPAVLLRPSMEYLRAGASSGTCKLTICLPKSGSVPSKVMECDAAPKQARGIDADPERPFELRQVDTPYAVNGKDISLKTNFPLVSAYHPVFGFAAPGKSFNDYQSPLVINFSKSSDLNLTDVWDNTRIVRFDLIGDGLPVRTGWVGKDAGFLAIDSNNNKKIDNGLELFGEYTSGAPSRVDGKRFDNGFLALAQYDSNHDGLINEKDKAFSQLVVWTDKNHDGTSQKNEVKKLSELKIQEISLAYKENLINGKPQNIAGNEARLTSLVKMTDGSYRNIVDVWFNQRRAAERPLAQIQK